MKTFLLWLCVSAAFLGLFGAYSTSFPGTNSPGRGLPAEGEEVATRLRRHVESLALDIGARDKPGPLADAAGYLERELRRAGVDARVSASGGDGAGTIVAEASGTKHAREIVILAAHYDGPRGSPAANAGASGAAVLVETARKLAGAPTERTLRFVLFPDGARRAGGEGSAAAAYAKGCKERGETIVAVLYVDSAGCFEDAGKPSYPFPLGLALPSGASFLAVVGSYQGRDLTSKTVEVLRAGTGLAIEGYVVPSFAPGTGFAPHAAFWQAGFPAVCLSDTGSWRSRNFATPSDTHDRLDYARMARVVQGLVRAAGQLTKKAGLAA
ncbi:MAG: M28 family peptidase [Planctomycetes bacterium]|nr:M28 family peptidase [Planctomycetota bacterium]